MIAGGIRARSALIIAAVTKEKAAHKAATRPKVALFSKGIEPIF